MEGGGNGGVGMVHCRHWQQVRKNDKMFPPVFAHIQAAATYGTRSKTRATLLG